MSFACKRQREFFNYELYYMKNLFLSLAFFLFAGLVSAQTVVDTIYLNSKYEATSKGDHEYFRVVTKEIQGIYEVKDFWKSGEISMSGKFSSLNPENKQGQFIYYHKGGALERIVNYRDNRTTGKVKRFDVNGKFDFEYLTSIESLDNADLFKKKIKELIRFAKTTISYPENEINREADGKVVVKFFVGDGGKVFRLSLAESASREFDDEVKRAILDFDKWPTPIYKGQKTLIEIIITMTFEMR